MNSGDGLVLLSGLGTDARLFAAQSARFPGLVVLPWMEPLADESLAGYAARMAQAAESLHPRWIGGCSFGGMLALEMAKSLSPRGIFLIGSCRKPESVTPALRFLGAVAARAPVFLWDLARRAAARWGPILFPGNPDSRAIATITAPAVPSSFVRWGVRAILHWEGCSDPGAPVHHIHGDADALIPIERVRADRVVSGAGHLLAATHADAVNAYLAEKMDGG